MIYVLSGAPKPKQIAFIDVTYPEGSTVTATNGTNVVALNDTSGTGTIGVPSLGSWTVSCTDGVNIKSQTVELTENGQTVEIEIHYFEAYITVNTSGTIFDTQLTCSDGINVYTYTTNVNDTHQFTVYNNGTWTITGVRNGQTKTQTINITANGELHTINFIFDLILYDQGNTYSDVTGGWTNSLSLSVSTTSMDGERARSYTRNRIPMNNYKTLYFQVTSSSQTRNGHRACGYNSNNTDYPNVGAKEPCGVGVNSIDISSVNTSYYVGMSIEAWPPQNGISSSTSLAVSKVWMSS